MTLLTDVIANMQAQAARAQAAAETAEAAAAAAGNATETALGSVRADLAAVTDLAAAAETEAAAAIQAAAAVGAEARAAAETTDSTLTSMSATQNDHRDQLTGSRARLTEVEATVDLLVLGSLTGGE